MKTILKKFIIINFTLSLLLHSCFFYKYVLNVPVNTNSVLNLLNNDTEFDIIIKTQSVFDKTGKVITPVQHYIAYDKSIRNIPEEQILTRYKNFNNLSFNLPLLAYKLPTNDKTGDG